MKPYLLMCPGNKDKLSDLMERQNWLTKLLSQGNAAFVDFQNQYSRELHRILADIISIARSMATLPIRYLTSEKLIKTRVAKIIGSVFLKHLSIQFLAFSAWWFVFSIESTANAGSRKCEVEVELLATRETGDVCNGAVSSLRLLSFKHIIQQCRR